MAAVKLGAAYGRLYVTGPDARRVTGVAGAAFNPRRNWYECTLTLEGARDVARALDVPWDDIGQYANDTLTRWLHAAALSDTRARQTHQRLAAGERVEFPWRGPADKPPMEHQRVMASAACWMDGLAFTCETGTSKTRPALEVAAYKLHHGEVAHVIWACPNGVVGTAEQQAALWLQGTVRVVPLVEMPVKERVAQLRAAATEDRPTIYILNFETLHAVHGAVVEMGKPFGLVVDEMHVLRNGAAKMTQAALTLAQHARWRLGITGSPILKGPEDIWSQWYLLDLGLTFGANLVQFRREYLTPHYSGFGWMPKPGAPERVGRAMLLRSLRYRKVDCLDLPPKLYERETVTMSPEQQTAYRTMQEELVARWTEDETRHRATAATTLASATRLAQIASGYVPLLDGTVHRFTANPKLTALERLVRENIADQQIIVWAWYRENIAQIVEALAEFHPLVIAGGVDKAARDAAELQFQEGQSRLLVGNPASGGRGLNLQAASLAIYYSQQYGLEARLQSEDRCHRKGSEQHAKVTFIDLVADGTVDELILRSNAQHQSLADIIVDLQRHVGMEPAHVG